MAAINLHDYAYVQVNSSGGKDSQTALRAIIQMAATQNYPRDQIVVFHADLGEAEWQGTKELAEAQARHYGLEFIVGRYRDKDGNELTLLEYVARRGKWADNKNRYCTSDFKRGPGNRNITAFTREYQALHGRKASHKVLNVFGFRAEESPARAKRDVLAANTRLCTKTRHVDDFNPILHLTEDQVWQDIEASGVDHHRAYDLGMPRLSCAFCIFAPKDALVLAGKHNPELLDKYCEVEERIGHRFTNKLSICEVRDEVRAGNVPETVQCGGCWNM